MSNVVISHKGTIDFDGVATTNQESNFNFMALSVGHDSVLLTQDSTQDSTQDKKSSESGLPEVRAYIGEVTMEQALADYRNGGSLFSHVWLTVDNKRQVHIEYADSHEDKLPNSEGHQSKLNQIVKSLFNDPEVLKWITGSSTN